MDILLHPLAFAIVSVVFGILILIFPRLLSYIAGIYLLIVGIMGFINYFSG